MTDHVLAPSGINPASKGRFSVLIPAYRAAEYILPVLEAVAAQRCQPMEVLIYEDGCFDDLAERVRGFAETAAFPVRLFQSAENKGVSRARNALLDLAQGEYIAFLDADDIWEIDHLQRAADLFADGADVVFSGVTFLDESGATLPGSSEPTEEDIRDIAASIFRYNFVQCTSTLSMRRSWIERVGNFDTSLSHGEDLDLWLRLIEAGAVWKYSGRCSCRYRKHAQSAMGQSRLVAERMPAFFEKHLHNKAIPLRARRKALLSTLWVHVKFSWKDKPAAAAAALQRLFQLQPWNPAFAVLWAAAALRARK